MAQSTLTVFFEEPFWVGVYERMDGERYEVCKITFGAEPKDYEVWEFLRKNWSRLRFSPPMKGQRPEERRRNPKRRQREIRSKLQESGVGTKAQQATGVRGWDEGAASPEVTTGSEPAGVQNPPP